MTETAASSGGSIPPIPPVANAEIQPPTIETSQRAESTLSHVPSGISIAESVTDSSPSPSVTGRHSSRLSSDSVERRGVATKHRGKLVSIEDYQVGNTIGKGAFAEVKLGFLDNMKYAIKIIETDVILKKFSFGSRPGENKAEEQMKIVTQEIEIMKTLNHPNLVRLYEVIHDDEHIYLVMEFVEGGPIMKYYPATKSFRCTLNSRLLGNNRGVMTEDWACKIFRGLISALGYLHERHIAHRDLKPENLLVDLEGNIKVTDFGVSRHFAEERQKTQITLKQLAKSQSRGIVTKTEGTWVFYSPEMCQEIPQTYSAYMADIWAAGVCLYVFVFNVLPFFNSEVRALFREIRDKDPLEILPKSISPDLLDLFRKLLAKLAKDRLSIADIEEHPWMVATTHTFVDPFRIAEEDEDAEDDESSVEPSGHKPMETNFSDYFRTMVSTSELSGTSGNSDDDDDDKKSDKPKPRPNPPMKLESIMSNASFICSAEFDNILDDPSTPKSGVKKRVSFRNEDKLSSIMDDDFSEEAVVVVSSDPFEYSLSDSITEKEDVTPLAHAAESDMSFSDNSTISKSSTKENLVSDKKADLVAPAVSTSIEAKPAEDDGISSKPPVACCVIS